MYPDSSIILRVLVVALAPLQWGTVFWYVHCFEFYPKNLLRRLIPWIFMMTVNVVIPIMIYLSNAHAKQSDDLVSAAGFLEGLVFLVLLFYQLKKLATLKSADNIGKIN